MSADFWVNLTLALLVFMMGLLFVNRSKFEFVRKLQAAYLRSKLEPKLREILPVISAQFQLPDANLFPIFRLKADIELLVRKSNSLFREERDAINNFLARLSRGIASFEAGKLSNSELEELILSGQRAINELSELGG